MKKIIGLFATVVVVMGTRGALAAELDADLEPQLVSDVQSLPAGENTPTACPATLPCCAINCPEAIYGRETSCTPRLALTVDAWFMHNQDRGELVPFVCGRSGAPLPDVLRLTFGNQAPITSSVAWNCTENYGPELRYMWMSDATASANDAAPHATGWKGQSSYQSSSQTTELNISKHFDRFGNLAGFTYANLKEQLSGVQSRPREPSTTAWIAQNNLPWAPAEGCGEAGICGTSAGNGFEISDNPVSFNPFDFANASLQLTPHIALRGGYKMLWLDGIAVAGRQVPTTGNFNFVGQATSHVDSAGAIINQCAKPSLEVTW